MGCSQFETRDSGERVQFASGMRRDTSRGKPRFELCVPEGVPLEATMFGRWAALMGRGAEKYAARNWERAETREEFERFRESAFRHFMTWLCGATDEDHAAAVFFNVQGAEYVRHRLREDRASYLTAAPAVEPAANPPAPESDDSFTFAVEDYPAVPAEAEPRAGTAGLWHFSVPTNPPRHRKRVYIAGPISKGDLADNINRATDAFLALMRAGLAPFCPHWSAFAGGCHAGTINGNPIATAERLPAGTTHEDWIGVDIPWVARADAVLRLPGESAGADAEVKEADRCGIPVFATVADVIAWAKGE